MWLNPVAVRTGPALQGAGVTPSRVLARLRLHGLIRKIAHQTKYYFTRVGRAVASTALGLRVFFVIPQPARPLTVSP